MIKLLAILKWFITSKWGLTILVAAAIAAGMALALWLFADHYYDKGKADCQGDLIAATAKANQAQAAANEARNKLASEVANRATASGAAVVKEADTTTQSTKEVIRYVYRDPPTTKPVAGSCVHPVDKRVQDRISEAVRAANG